VPPERANPRTRPLELAPELTSTGAQTTQLWGHAQRTRCCLPNGQLTDVTSAHDPAAMQWARLSYALAMADTGAVECTTSAPERAVTSTPARTVSLFPGSSGSPFVAERAAAVTVSALWSDRPRRRSPTWLGAASRVSVSALRLQPRRTP
jgi:hypothetical protein